ncbi:hypothetical protein [Nocardia testacea]|uniref:hypothetical protein n=1 Tax=Nocardia testacea TaxID=248551 RepID=UPI003A8A9279
MRDNLLTPQSRSGIFQLAGQRDCGVLITKPLAQGLLTGHHDPTRTRHNGPGDHQFRKRWFTSEAVAITTYGLDRLRQLSDTEPHSLIRIALWSSLQRSNNAAVLAGFTRANQITTSIACLADPPPAHTIEIPHAASWPMSSSNSTLAGRSSPTNNRKKLTMNDRHDRRATAEPSRDRRRSRSPPSVRHKVSYSAPVHGLHSDIAAHRRSLPGTQGPVRLPRSSRHQR